MSDRLKELQGHPAIRELLAVAETITARHDYADYDCRIELAENLGAWAARWLEPLVAAMHVSTPAAREVAVLNLTGYLTGMVGPVAISFSEAETDHGGYVTARALVVRARPRE